MSENLCNLIVAVFITYCTEVHCFLRGSFPSLSFIVLYCEPNLPSGLMPVSNPGPLLQRSLVRYQRATYCTFICWLRCEIIHLFVYKLRWCKKSWRTHPAASKHTYKSYFLLTCQIHCTLLKKCLLHIQKFTKEQWKNVLGKYCL